MAETIVFGGQKLDIDPNDELWKQLVEKYSKKKTGWEKPEKHSKAYMIHSGLLHGTNRIDDFYRSEDNIDANAWKRAAIFEDENFCRMQARAEEIRRKMLRWVAENDKPLSVQDDHWGLVYNVDTCTWRAVRHAGRPSIFGVHCSSEKLALEFAMFFEDELKWMFFEYQRRLDEVKE